jgi:CubicO group peptidase (beta-lactamase class C family)
VEGVRRPQLRAVRAGRALAFLGGLFFGGPAAADPIDDYLRAEMARRQVPGLALGVARHGRVERISVYGLANVELGTPVTERSVFAIASLDKQLTAAGVLALAESGKLSLDDELRRYVEVPWRGITLRHLLSHTAGLPDEVAAGFEERSFADHTTEQLLAHVRRLVPVAPPGERYLYSDAGLFLAQLAIEKAAGQPWREFTRQRIFAPSGMAGATFLDPAALVEGRVAGYALDREGRLRRDRRTDVDYGPLYNDLGMTARDFASWLLALDGDTPLGPASRAAMWTPLRLADGSSWSEVWQWRRYGLGFGLDEVFGHRVALHSGSSGVGVLKFLDHGLSIVVLTNLAHSSGSDPLGLALGVAGLLWPEVDWLERPPAPDPEPRTTAAHHAEYRNLLADRPALESYAAASRLAAFEGAPALAGRASRWGTLASFTFLGESRAGDERLRRYRAEHASARIFLTVALDTSGRILSLQWAHI